jgi:hypothetical protein
MKRLGLLALTIVAILSALLAGTASFPWDLRLLFL